MPTDSAPHWIGGSWTGSAGPIFHSVNPADGSIVWEGPAADPDTVAAAFLAAAAAQPDWEELGSGGREPVLRAFAAQLEARSTWLAEAISLETGKPDWEAATEVRSMIGKLELSLKAQGVRASEFQAGPAITRFRALGVAAVLGPFNFPGHLPNGQILPALIAGNTIVFKPSDRTPLVARRTIELWQAAGLPAGVLNLVQGGPATGAAVVDDPRLDALFFTGSARTGAALHRRFAGDTRRLLALEMGGNNPLVVWPQFDAKTAALIVVQSAFLTAGQRCTCARRLILPADRAGDVLLEHLLEWMAGLRVGPHTERPEPFCGPVISAEAAAAVLAAQEQLAARGGRILSEARLLVPGTGLTSPGLIDVSAVRDREDEELFGPLLQVIRVGSFEDALAEASATRFGLAAGLVCEDETLWRRFRRSVRAGVLNWNTQLTGASGAAPFGGTGLSGNHRPGAYFTADSCNWPVASMETRQASLPANLPPGLS